jgi:hypothetical protein
MASPLKITFPTNLPKNEKDLICMLLAGRLKDLFKGRLVCAQLAIDDLIKETTGVSALGSLRNSLVNMSSAINGLKAATGYNAILNGVNQALGQVNNVFSLGGLCPSPVRAPQIPDLLGKLNSNLFGQANNILNALGKAMNPSMCLGGGPGGFGINWNSFPGDLKNLKSTIQSFKNDPAGFNSTISAFEKNIKSQVSRMNSEVKRLQQNLADPLGLNNKLNTSRSLQRAKKSSDGYPVKDAQGILHKNALRSMVTADVEAVIDNGDNTIVTYKTVPILNYCGDIEGYKRVAITGPLEYAGWDPNNPELNQDTPTVNPTATYLNYDYLFKEESNVIRIYDKTGAVVSDINIARGNAYRFGFELSTCEIKIYSDNGYTTTWTEGFTYSRSPVNGGDLEILYPDSTVSYLRGELDWRALIENPTTPNSLYWRATNNQYGNINVDPNSPTVVPVEDRTYDISMAMKKSALHLKTIPATSEIPVAYDDTDTSIYFLDSNGVNVPVTITDDTDTADINGNANPYNKVIKTVVNLNGKYLIIKRFVNIENVFGLNKIYFYTSTTTNEQDADRCVLLKFDDTIYPLNSTKLPHTLPYSYELAFLEKNGSNYIPSTTPIRNSDQMKFELVQSGDKQFIRYNVTMYTEATKAMVPVNEFILQTDIEIPTADLSRSFVNSNPTEARTYVYIKFADETAEATTVSYEEIS